MGAITLAVATRVLAEPLVDLYKSGKEKFSKQLSRWQGAQAHKQLAQKIAVAEKVKTFWRSDKSVALSRFYYPNKVRFGRSAKPISVASLSDLPREGSYVIQGTIGQGKSIFLRHLCVQELSETGTRRIPILIELRLLSAGGLYDEIKSTLKTFGFDSSEDLIDFYLRSGRVVLLLDAFDELDESLIKNTVAEIDRLAATYDQLQIFVTARPQSAIEHSRHFQVVRLVPLAPADHEPFLRRIGLESHEIKKLLNATRAGSGRVYSLLTTPLILTLLVVVYQSEQSIPEELSDFFQKLFQTLFSKHDSAKPGFRRKHKSGLSERKLQQLFQGFCFAVLQLKLKTTLKQSQFENCFDRGSSYTGVSCELDGFKHDVVKVACLMIEEGYDIQFLHKSVLEFFAACFVAERAEDVARGFYQQLLSQNWYQWTQVLSFLSQIDRYRFLKYFEIPCIDQMLLTLGLTSDRRVVLDAKDVAERVFEGYAVDVIRGEDGLSITGFGPFTLSRFRVARDLDDPMFDRLAGEFESEPRLEALLSNLKQGETKEVDWHHFFSEAEIAKLQAKTLVSIRQIQTAREAHLRFIAEEDAKAELLKI